MRNAKGLVLDLAVAVVDGVAPFASQLLELFQIGAAVAGAGGEGQAAIALGGEQTESLIENPLASRLGHAPMAGVTVLQALGEEFAQLVGQGENQAQGRGARGVVLEVVGGELLEIEVVAAIGGGLGLGQGFRRDGEDRQPRRQAEGLLHPGQADIGAKGGDVDGHRAHRRDGVDDEGDLGIFFHHLGDFRQGTQHPGGGFVMNQGHGVVLAGAQGRVNHFRGNRLAPLGGKEIGLQAAAPGDVVPLGTEGAVAEVGAALLDQVAHRPFHDPEGAGSGKKDGIFGVQQPFQTGRHFMLEGGVVLAAVANHRRAHGLVDIGADLHRARDVEFFVHALDAPVAIVGSTSDQAPMKKRPALSYAEEPRRSAVAVGTPCSPVVAHLTPVTGDP